MTWKNVRHVTIYRESGWYAAHPAIVRTPSGALLALFHRYPDTGSPDHSHPLFDVRACRSTDEGRTWSAPVFVTAYARGGVLDFGAHTLPDGSIFVHASTSELAPETKGAHSQLFRVCGGRPFWVRSRDDGRSWTEPVPFPPLPDALWGDPASHSGVCRSGIAVLPGGRLLAPSKATDRPDGSMPFFGMLRVSDDMGETWSYGGRIAEDAVAHFSEPAIHITPSGRILVLFRCHPFSGIRSDDPALRLALVYSDDGGRTWSAWRQTTVRGCPPHLLGLKDGRILTTVGTRWPGQCGVMARVLDPEGADLDNAAAWSVRGDSQNPDCGYPWAVRLADGSVLVTYYYVHADGVRGIEGTIVEEA